MIYQIASNILNEVNIKKNIDPIDDQIKADYFLYMIYSLHIFGFHSQIV
jgi:hypothetical protein